MTQLANGLRSAKSVAAVIAILYTRTEASNSQGR